MLVTAPGGIRHIKQAVSEGECQIKGILSVDALTVNVIVDDFRLEIEYFIPLDLWQDQDITAFDAGLTGALIDNACGDYLSPGHPSFIPIEDLEILDEKGIEPNADEYWRGYHTLIPCFES